MNQQLKEWEEMRTMIYNASGVEPMSDDMDRILNVFLSLLTRKSEEIGGLRKEVVIDNPKNSNPNRLSRTESYNQALSDAQAILLKG